MTDVRHGWLYRAALDTARALPYLLVGVITALVSLFAIPVLLIVLVLSAIGVGLPLLPKAVLVLRALAGVERRRLATFTGEPVPSHYPPLTGPLIEQAKVALFDRSTRRDLAWLVIHGVTGSTVGFLAAALPLSSLNSFLVPFYWWAMPPDAPAEQFFPVTSWPLALATVALGFGYLLLGFLVVPPLTRWQTRMARRRLAPPWDEQLTERVAALADSRAAALEAHGAELRRIERDLHDGTQNRIVAVVMQLGIAERALRRDPASALPMVLRAQDAANDALVGLRDVVRSIYPPVLAERGLDGAVAGLVARCAVPATLTVAGLRRAPAAVESAAYFTVAEALTNVAKHSGAHKAEVVLSTVARPGPGAHRRDDEGDLLVVQVTDDGLGGVDERSGTGVTGIRRRVAALGGQTTVDSPVGGPTVLRVELPCES